MRQSVPSTKFWKWRARSNKSTSEFDGREISYTSPTSSVSVGPQLSTRDSSSPFLSESAHVLSLQQPAEAPDVRRTSCMPILSPASSKTVVKLSPDLPEPSPSSVDTVVKQHQHLLSVRRYHKMKKDIESKLKKKPRRPVRCVPICCHIS